MSEIKFRFTFKNGNLIAQRFRTLDELLDCSFAQEEMEEDIWSSRDFEDEPQLELIAKDEYTILKDKNGVEIYKGDICSLNGDIHIVGYQDGCFLMIEETEFNGEIDPLYKYFFEEYEETDLEVIGNIYENPELLKETK